MINSMTGYGTADSRFDGATYVVEIKTVNSRYFKSKVKLPDSVAFLEEEVERLLRKKLARGTVEYTLWFRNASTSVLFEINEDALKACIKRLERICVSADTAGSGHRIDIGGLLELPGIIQPASPDKKTAMRMKKVILNTTNEALNRLKKMRSVEGAVLADDMEENCKVIKKAIEQIRLRSGVVQQKYYKKLRKRVDEMLAEAKLKLDEATLAREAAVFADRSDISEEISRLDSHLKQFNKICLIDGQAGRQLDFLSQEMLREANTIGSKASDTEIIRLVVEIKCRIERIKEQVQNVE